MPSVERWTVYDAVSWIAFRQEPSSLPPLVEPDVVDGRMLLEPLMAALEALATGNSETFAANDQPVPWPTYPPGLDNRTTSARHYLEIAGGWVEEARAGGLTAPELLAKAKADLAQYGCDTELRARQDAACEAALQALNDAIRSGDICMHARRSPTWAQPLSPPPREPVPPNHVDEKRRLHMDGTVHLPSDDLANLFHDEGPFYYDAQLVADDVRRCWPAGGAGEQPVDANSPPEPIGTGAPGRPSSMYLILAEFDRRKEQVSLEQSKNQQAQALRTWLCAEHPDRPPPTVKTISNQLPTGLWPGVVPKIK